jgi:hypothetical protein
MTDRERDEQVARSVAGGLTAPVAPVFGPGLTRGDQTPPAPSPDPERMRMERLRPDDRYRTPSDIAAAPTTTVVPDRVVAGRDRAIQQARFLMSFHLGGPQAGFSPAMLEPLAEKFVDKFGFEDPTMLRKLEEDYRWLVALKDDDVAQLALSGGSLAPQTGTVFDVFAEVALEASAFDLWAKTQVEAEDRDRANWQKITGQDIQAAFNDALAESKNEYVVRPKSGVAHLEDRPAVWTVDDGMLALQAISEDPGEAPITYGVRLDPGTRVESTVDALEALIQARLGWRHELVVDPHAGEKPGSPLGSLVSKVADAIRAGNDTRIVSKAQEFIIRSLAFGGGAQAVGDLMAGGADDAVEQWRESERMRRLHHIERGDFNDQLNRELLDQVVTGMAVEIAEQANQGYVHGVDDLPPPGSGQVILAAGQARDLASVLLAENPDLVDFDALAEQTKEQVISAVEAELDDQTIVGSTITKAVGGIMWGFDKWDDVTQRYAVNIVDFLHDASQLPHALQDTPESRQALSDALGVDPNDPDTGLEQGKTAMQAWWEAVQTTPEEDNVADYWGLEGGAADWALLTAGILADPTNLLLGGPKFAAKLGAKAVTNPAYAGIWVKLPGPQRVVRAIASSDTQKAVRAVFALDGLTTDQYRTAIRLARDPDSSKEAVEELLKSALPSTDGAGFLSIMPTERVASRQLADFVEKTLDVLPLVDEDTIAAVLATTSKLHRSRVVNLNGQSFIDEFMDVVVDVHARDPDVMARWGERALDAVDQAGLRRDETLVLFRARVDEAAKAVDEALEARRVATAGADAEIARLSPMTRARQEAAEAASKRTRGADDFHTLEELAADRDSVWQALEDTKRIRAAATKEADAKVAEAQTKLWEARRALGWAEEAETNRLTARVVAEFYDEVARDLGLRKTGDRLKEFPDLAEYDWSPVVGASRSNQAAKYGRAGQEFTEKGPAQLDVFSDPEIRRQLEMIGLFNRQSTVPLPVSPFEIAMYRKLRNQPELLQKWQASQARQQVWDVYRMYRGVFAANLLFNSFTPLVTNADEVSRFLAVTGRWFDSARGFVAPVPGLGRVAAGQAVDSHGAQFASDHLGSLGARTRDQWTWVDRPTRARARGAGIPGADRTLGAYKQQVERFLNGTLAQDDVFREYAAAVRRGAVRYVDDPNGFNGVRAVPADGDFRQWWEVGLDPDNYVDGVLDARRTRPGRDNARTHKIAFGGVDSIDADYAFGAVDTAFRMWIDEFVDAGARTRVKARILEAATDPSKRLTVQGDGSVLGAVRRIPGVPGVNDVTNPAQTRFWWEHLYGTPQQRRGSIFFDHFYAEDYGTLRTAYERKGKLLTDEVVQRELGKQGIDLTLDEAALILKRGADDPAMGPLLRSGFVTDDTLRSIAARRAGRKADDLMYRFEASTMWGEKAEVILPFARAQADFIRWWSRHLTNNNIVRLPAGWRAAMDRTPGLQQALRAIEGTVERVPLNVRAIARWSHLAAITNNEHEGTYGADWFFRAFTFFPLKNSPDVIMDVWPTLQGLPAWLIESQLERLDDDTALKAFHEIFPALRFAASNPFDLSVSASSRSLRNVLGSTIQGLEALYGEATGDPWGGKFREAMRGFGSMANRVVQPPNISSLEADQFIQFARSDDFDRLSPGSAEWDERAQTDSYTAYTRGVGRQVANTLAAQAKLDRYDPDPLQVEGYRGLMDDFFPMLAAQGILPSSVTYDEGGEGRLERVWRKWNESPDTLTRAEVRYMTDEFAGIVFKMGQTEYPGLPGVTWRDVFFALHPEATANSTSKLMISPGLLEERGEGGDWARAHVGEDGVRVANLPAGVEGAKERNMAMDKGWVTKRPYEDWSFDAHTMADSARRKVIQAIWEKVTGKDWRKPYTFNTETGQRESSLAKEIQGRGVNLSDSTRTLLAAVGVDIPDGPLTTDRFADLLYARVEQLIAPARPITVALQNSQAARRMSREPDGQRVLDILADVNKTMEDRGFDRFKEWPGGEQEKVREILTGAVDLGWITPTDYNVSWAGVFGPLEWEPPKPPPPAELEAGIVIGSEHKDRVVVIDGDTVGVILADGVLRFRLVGINAPESGEEGGAEATAQLQRMIDLADTVTFGFYKPEVFGSIQQSGPTEKRLIGWLYINDVPLWDPTVFTATNQTGAGFGGRVSDLMSLYEQAGGKMKEPAEAGGLG